MIVLCSGGMDPIHEGHIDYLEGAAEYGEVIVALNSDEWLFKKKGYVFMSWRERARIIKALKAVDDVIKVNDENGTVCDALRRIKPDYFANGGDRTEWHTDEHKVCVELGIRELFNVGGGKANSSSKLINNVREKR